MRDLEAELREETGAWPPAWKPVEGEIITGTIKRYTTAQSAFGPVRVALVERDDGRRVSVWLSSVVLLDCFRRENPAVGERIGIRYLGKHAAKHYHRYVLLVDRAAPPSFEPLGGEMPALPEYATSTTDRSEAYAAVRSGDGDEPDPDPFVDE